MSILLIVISRDASGIASSKLKILINTSHGEDICSAERYGSSLILHKLGMTSYSRLAM